MLDAKGGTLFPKIGTAKISYVVAAVLGIASSGPIAIIQRVPNITANGLLTFSQSAFTFPPNFDVIITPNIVSPTSVSINASTDINQL